jgi:hypothetical protein
MPTYEFRCNDTGKEFDVTFKTVEEYDQATVKSPFTGTTNVSRIIRRVAISSSESTRWDRLSEGDPQAIAELDNADPRALGRALRHFGDESELNMGDEFNDVIDRLESGQSPEAIEQQLPSSDDGRWLEGLGSGIPGTQTYAPEDPGPGDND